MARRRLLLPAAALGVALAIGGCAYGTPATLTPAQEHARVQLLKDHPTLSDRELAQLCPGMYPKDFLTNTGKYPEAKLDKHHKATTVTAAMRAQAKAAGCDVRPT